MARHGNGFAVLVILRGNVEAELPHFQALHSENVDRRAPHQKQQKGDYRRQQKGSADAVGFAGAAGDGFRLRFFNVLPADVAQPQKDFLSVHT